MSGMFYLYMIITQYNASIFIPRFFLLMGFEDLTEKRYEIGRHEGVYINAVFVGSVQQARNSSIS
jgi:hypothetical protein